MSEFLAGSRACCRVTGEAGSGEAGISRQEGKGRQRGERRWVGWEGRLAGPRHPHDHKSIATLLWGTEGASGLSRQVKSSNSCLNSLKEKSHP